jgi:hypothetical protein
VRASVEDAEVFQREGRVEAEHRHRERAAEAREPGPEGEGEGVAVALALALGLERTRIGALVRASVEDAEMAGGGPR